MRRFQSQSQGNSLKTGPPTELIIHSSCLRRTTPITLPEAVLTDTICASKNETEKLDKIDVLFFIIKANLSLNLWVLSMKISTSSLNTIPIRSQLMEILLEIYMFSTICIFRQTRDRRARKQCIATGMSTFSPHLIIVYSTTSLCMNAFATQNRLKHGIIKTLATFDYETVCIRVHHRCTTYRFPRCNLFCANRSPTAAVAPSRRVALCIV